MYRRLIALSRCMGRSSHKKNKEITYIFHFKGVYLGQKVSGIHLNAKSMSIVLDKDSDYLLFMDVVCLKEDIIFGKLIKYKEIV